MRRPAHFGFTLSEFAITLAALAAVSLLLHPIVAQARNNVRKPTFARQDNAFQLYATDVDGAFGDFEGKPILLDGLTGTLASYRQPGALYCAVKPSSAPTTGCMPITRFQASLQVVESGSAAFWEGQVANAGSGSCSVRPYAENPVLTVPSWGELPVSPSGSFWLMAGALEEGIGTILVETNTGAEAEGSVLVLD